MNLLLPWIRIFLAVFAYIVIALLASAIVRKIGQNLKEMEGRTSPQSPFCGSNNKPVRAGNYTFVASISR